MYIFKYLYSFLCHHPVMRRELCVCVCLVCVQCSGNSLSSVALGGGVEGGQLHVVEVLGAHLIEDLLKGVELTVRRVHVVLVNLEKNSRQLCHRLDNNKRICPITDTHI